MREIKFRAWHKEVKTMTPSIYNQPVSVEWYILRDEYEVMQYTGLKDSNNTEIYEGDIIKCYDETVCCKSIIPIGVFEVVFSKGGFWLSNDDYDFLGWAGDDTREVIGNVYENPELLA